MTQVDSYRSGMDEKATAEYLGISVSSIPRLVKSGKLPAPVVFGDQKRWSAKEIDCLMSADIVPISTRQPKLRVENVPSPSGVLSREDIIAVAVPIQPCHSGIYFLISGGCIVYVGQSVNILARIASHAKEKIFDSWHWVSCPPQSLDYWERTYIDALMPPLNSDRMTVQLRAIQRNKTRDA